MNRNLSSTVMLGLLPLGVIVLQGCTGLENHGTETLLSPSLKRSEVVGFVAGLGTTFAALPDLLTMLKRRSSAGMNPRMAGIMCVFQFAWLYYGLPIASRPVVAWNAVGIVINAFTVVAFFHFARKQRNRAAG